MAGVKPTISITIENNLPKAKDGLKYALEQWAKYTGGKMVNLTARDRFSRGTPVDTGRLRNSMDYATDADNKTVYVGTNVEYALDVEEGKPNINYGFGKGVGAHMLRNAVMDVKDDSEAFLKRVLEDNPD